MFKTILDSSRKNSLGNRFRRRRFTMFTEMIKDLPKPLRVIDLGGNENFWIQMGLAGKTEIEITLVNPEEVDVTASNIKYIKGDACYFRSLGADYDIVFSNSAIEHVGGSERSRLMASEIAASGKPFFVQTPNYYFPFEPHFLFPLFQFFPERFKIFLLMNFNMGWYTKCRTYAEALSLIRSVQLLKKSDLETLFPGAELKRERFLGLTKSFIAISKP
jgi:hypothetical protein